jgi:hypothetical protein
MSAAGLAFEPPTAEIGGREPTDANDGRRP